MDKDLGWLKTVRYSGSAGAQEVLCGGNLLANVSVGCLHQCTWLLFLTLSLSRTVLKQVSSEHHEVNC
jgi:hypothetical protein